jgi:hypothetical protein
VPKRIFDIYETTSLRAGGVAACQYLDSIGKTDMAELTEVEWLLFFTKYAGAYEDKMKNSFEELAK